MATRDSETVIQPPEDVEAPQLIAPEEIGEVRELVFGRKAAKYSALVSLVGMLLLLVTYLSTFGWIPPSASTNNTPRGDMASKVSRDRVFIRRNNNYIMTKKASGAKLTGLPDNDILGRKVVNGQHGHHSAQHNLPHLRQHRTIGKSYFRRLSVKDSVLSQSESNLNSRLMTGKTKGDKGITTLMGMLLLVIGWITPRASSEDMASEVSRDRVLRRRHVKMATGAQPTDTDSQLGEHAQGTGNATSVRELDTLRDQDSRRLFLSNCNDRLTAASCLKDNKRHTSDKETCLWYVKPGQIPEQGVCLSGKAKARDRGGSIYDYGSCYYTAGKMFGAPECPDGYVSRGTKSAGWPNDKRECCIDQRPLFVKKKGVLRGTIFLRGSGISPCPPGQYRVGLTPTSGGRCTQCPIGTFKITSGYSTTMCTPCASHREGFYLQFGSGTFSDPSQCGGPHPGVPKKCPSGSYQDCNGSSSCLETSCKLCKDCPVGTELIGCNDSHSGECHTCRDGKYKDHDGPDPCRPCEACEAGYHKPDLCSASEAGNCHPCPEGYYKNMKGSHDTPCLECEPCAGNSFRTHCEGTSPGRCSKLVITSPKCDLRAEQPCPHWVAGESVSVTWDTFATQDDGHQHANVTILLDGAVVSEGVDPRKGVVNIYVPEDTGSVTAAHLTMVVTSLSSDEEDLVVSEPIVVLSREDALAEEVRALEETALVNPMRARGEAQLLCQRTPRTLRVPKLASCQLRDILKDGGIYVSRNPSEKDFITRQLTYLDVYAHHSQFEINALRFNEASEHRNDIAELSFEALDLKMKGSLLRNDLSRLQILVDGAEASIQIQREDLELKKSTFDLSMQDWVELRVFIQSTYTVTIDGLQRTGVYLGEELRREQHRYFQYRVAESEKQIREEEIESIIRFAKLAVAAVVTIMSGTPGPLMTQLLRTALEEQGRDSTFLDDIGNLNVTYGVNQDLCDRPDPCGFQFPNYWDKVELVYDWLSETVKELDAEDTKDAAFRSKIADLYKNISIMKEMIRVFPTLYAISIHLLDENVEFNGRLPRLVVNKAELAHTCSRISTELAFLTKEIDPHNVPHLDIDLFCEGIMSLLEQGAQLSRESAEISLEQGRLERRLQKLRSQTLEIELIKHDIERIPAGVQPPRSKGKSLGRLFEVISNVNKAQKESIVDVARLLDAYYASVVMGKGLHTVPFRWERSDLSVPGLHHVWLTMMEIERTVTAQESFTTEHYLVLDDDNSPATLKAFRETGRTKMFLPAPEGSDVYNARLIDAQTYLFPVVTTQQEIVELGVIPGPVATFSSRDGRLVTVTFEKAVRSSFETSYSTLTCEKASEMVQEEGRVQPSPFGDFWITERSHGGNHKNTTAIVIAMNVEYSRRFAGMETKLFPQRLSYTGEKPSEGLVCLRPHDIAPIAWVPTPLPTASPTSVPDLKASKDATGDAIEILVVIAAASIALAFSLLSVWLYRMIYQRQGEFELVPPQEQQEDGNNANA